MKKIFEKIIKKLQSEVERWEDSGKQYNDRCEIAVARGLRNAIEIVKQTAAEYNNGWIPVSERLPETDKYILLSFSNFSIPCVGRYNEDENGGAFYIGDEDETCVSQYLFVNAWQPLPAPYQPKGE